MRLQPVAATPLQRVAVRNVRLSNRVVIPAGVTIELSQFTVMLNDAWGWKDGTSFIPVCASLALQQSAGRHVCMPILYEQKAVRMHP